MASFVPFLGMAIVVLAEVSSMIVSKQAMSKGLSEFILAFYSNGFSTMVLLPSCFIFHRSDELRSLSFSLLSSFFLLGLVGCSGMLLGYAGLQYSSATLNTAMLNLKPAFTFILALIFRMEKLNLRKSSSQAKSVGTVVSIAGAFIMTFYQGPPVIKAAIYHLGFTKTKPFLFISQSHWILGGFLLAAESFAASLWFIIQASILKKYPAVLIIILSYSFFVTVESGIIALIMEKDLSAWRLQPDIRLVAVLYAGIIRNAFRFCLLTWCLKETGPLYVSMFEPLSVVVADLIDVLFLGQTLYLGSLVGAAVIIIGFYGVMWGKAKEQKAGEISEEGSLESSSENVPLLQNKN
ncbi:hypothetical protein UlMin_040343 [Ulmus minor]